MRALFCADWRVLMLAAASIAVFPFASLQAQTEQGQGKVGTEATPAMGSQVAPMKPDCASSTAGGDKKVEHAPTAAMSKNVPPMNPQDCPADDAVTGTKTPPK